MSGVNKVFLIGNLGADPEVGETSSGSKYARMRLATSRKYKNRDGQMVDETEWHNVATFGRLAETCGQFLSKGRQVCVEGRLKTEQYEKDGVTKYMTKVIADNVTFLSSGSGERTGAATSNDFNAQGFDEIPF